MHALEGANFELRKGEHVAIMGDNGAGKSTFVRQITGVEKPTRGKITFHGQEMSFSGDAQAGLKRCFKRWHWPNRSHAPSNLFLGREKFLFKLGPFSVLDRKAMRDATRKALERTGVKIPNLANTIRRMSGGQRQCARIATHCRCPPDIRRMVLARLGIFTPVRSSALRVASRIALRSRTENGPKSKQEFLAAQKQVGRHIKIIGQCQRLKHRFNAGLPRIQRAFETHLLSVENDLAARRLFNTRELPHERGLARTIVAHDGHMLTLAQFKVSTFQRMHAAIMLGEAFGFENDI